jgi:hypothetical protein
MKKKEVFSVVIVLVLAALASQPAKSQNWSENFDEYPLNSFPSANWTPSGNNGTSIVNTTYISKPQSVQMLGQVGGCWAALIHRQLEVKPPFTIEMYVRNGNETVSGCHPQRAEPQLQTGPSWTDPNRVLWNFDASGHFIVPGTTTGPQLSPLTWVKIGVSYELSDATHVKMNYSINDKFYKSVTVAQDTYESQLVWLSLQAAEGTVWYDNVSVASGFTINPPCTLSDTVSYNAANGTLTMNFTVGNDTTGPLNWSGWLTYADPQGSDVDTMQNLFSGSLAVTNPPQVITKTVSLPLEGTVGVLSTISTAKYGIACSNWVHVNTGTDPLTP